MRDEREKIDDGIGRIGVPAAGRTGNAGQRLLGAEPEWNFQYGVGGAGLFIIGVLNGSLASGTGLFATLWLVSWFGLDYRGAVAYTLVLVGVFWNGSGALTLGLLGNIRWDWLPALVLGSLLGGYAGAHLAIAKGNHWIKRVYELITVTVGLSLILH